MALVTEADLTSLITILTASDPDTGCLLTPLPCRAGVVHGIEVDDSCEVNRVTGADGQLTVTMTNVQTTWDSEKCANFDTVVRVRLVRCVPTVDGNGTAPSAQALEASALQLRSDAQVLANAVTCCWRPHGARVAATLTPYGPTGGCGGWELEVTVRDSICC